MAPPLAPTQATVSHPTMTCNSSLSPATRVNTAGATACTRATDIKSYVHRQGLLLTWLLLLFHSVDTNSPYILSPQQTNTSIAEETQLSTEGTVCIRG